MNIFTIVYLIMFFFGIFFILIFFFIQKRYEDKLFDFPKIIKYYSISFLVPAYNEEDSIENTVRALMNLKYPKGKIEIIIINDGSKDNTLSVAKALAKKYDNVYVLNKENSGKANSLNEAIKIAKGELIAVVDADSYPKNDSVSKMIGYFDDPKVAAVTSRVLVKNKENWLCRFQILDYGIIAWTRKLLDFVNAVYVTNGPLSIYRKSIVKKVGGFDPKNLTEDIEITWNILSRGYQTRMSYGAIVYTIVPKNLKVWVKQRVRWNLGGIQTVHKYWRAMFKKGAFGYFIIPYVSASFILAIIGFMLLIRYFWITGTYYLSSLYYYFQGYDPFLNFDFNFYLTLLFVFGAIFFCLAIWYYKIGFKQSESKSESLKKILIYSFIYRSLYIVPLIIAFYKLAKRDIRWYTK